MSKLEIINQALGILGANQIYDINEEVLEAQAAKKMYEPALTSILSELDWNFAIKRVLLPLSDKKPTWGSGNYFELPSDLVKISEIMGNVKWTREGNYILSDSHNFGISYVSRCTDATLYPPYFIEAFAMKLACDMCYLLTNSTEKTSALLELYKGEYLPIAKNKNSREKSNPVINDSYWVNSIYGGMNG